MPQSNRATPQAQANRRRSVSSLTRRQRSVQSRAHHHIGDQSRRSLVDVTRSPLIGDRSSVVTALASAFRLPYSGAPSGYFILLTSLSFSL